MTGDRRAWFWIAGLAAFLFALYLLSSILLPFVAGMVLSYLLDPFADWMERHKVPRWAAAGLITLLAVASVVLAFLLLVPLLHTQLVDLASRIPGYVDVLRGKTVAFLAQLQAQLSPQDVAALREKIGSFAGPDALAWIGGLLKRIWGGGVALVNLLSLLVITPVVMFYLLRDWDRIVAAADSWLPRSQAPVIREQVVAIDAVLSGFLRGQVSVCLLLGAFYAIGLTVVGLDFGLIIGFATGLISFVPYFGMLTGFAVGLGVALAQFDTWQPIVMVVGVFAVGQFLEGNFITPKLVGSRIGLHPVWIIFALLAGGALFGFTGVLLAVPGAAVIGVLGRFAIGKYRASEAYLGERGSDDDADGHGTDTGSSP